MRISDWSSDVCSSDLWIYVDRQRILKQRYIGIDPRHDIIGSRHQPFGQRHRHLAVIARILDQHPAVIGQRRQQDIALPRMWPVLVARQPDLLGPAAKVGIARAEIGEDRKSTSLNSSH